MISDEKYSMVQYTWNQAIEAQDRQWALAGAPVNTPSGCQLPSGTSQKIVPQTGEPVSDHSVFCSSIGHLMMLYPRDIRSYNWRLLPFEGAWHMKHDELLSIGTGCILDQRLSFKSKVGSSCSMMHISRRSSMILNHGSHGWKCLTQSTTNVNSLPISWGDNRPHRSSFNLSHRRC